jgi:predicted neuraminidase
MTPEDEEFTRIEMESRVKQEYVRSMNRKRQIAETRDGNNRMIDAHQAHVIQLMDELAIARVAVRELGDRLSKVEKSNIQVRNDTLEEAIKEVEYLAVVLGVDTVHVFMTLLRSMKE